MASGCTILDDLPGRGNYHTNMVAVGPDGWLYFSQGAMTNSGVVGLDAYDLAWLKQLPHPSDLPGFDIALAGEVFDTSDPFAPGQRAEDGGVLAVRRRRRAQRSALRPGAVHGLGACAAGRTAQSFRWWHGGCAMPMASASCPTDACSRRTRARTIADRARSAMRPTVSIVVDAGAWYGWPDFVCGRPVTDPDFKPQRGPQPRFILADHETLPPPRRPVVEFAVNAAATKFAVLPAQGRWPGQLIVAMFGDEKPMTAPQGPRVGRGLLRIDPRDWSQHALPAGPFVRPIDVVATPRRTIAGGRFRPLRDAGPSAGSRRTRGSGKLWKIRLD